MGSIYNDHEKSPERLTPDSYGIVQSAAVYVGGNDKKSIGILSRGQDVDFEIKGSMDLDGGHEPDLDIIQGLGGTANADELLIVDITGVIGWLAVEFATAPIPPSEVILFWNLGRNA